MIAVFLNCLFSSIKFWKIAELLGLILGSVFVDVAVIRHNRTILRYVVP